MRPQFWFLRSHLSEAQCDDIVTFCETFPDQDGVIFTSDGTYDVNDMRRSRIRWVERYSDVGEMMMAFFRMANRNFDFSIEDISSLQYTEYHGNNEGHYDWHIDVNYINDVLYDRKLSMTIQLSHSDEYEGGDFELRNSDLPEGLRDRGSILVFPAYLYHRVTPVTSGLRRSLVTWCEGPRWR